MAGRKPRTKIAEKKNQGNQTGRYKGNKNFLPRKN